MKPKLSNLAKLAKDVPPNAPLLFGSEEDINKRITKLMATNSVMEKHERQIAKKLQEPPSLPLWDEGSQKGKTRGRS